MQKRLIDFIVGLFMIAGIAGLLMLAYRVSSFNNFDQNGSYTLSANFDNIGGLKVRAPITISGVKVGQVAAISLDPTTFKAKVTLVIDEQDNNIPVDSSASIFTQGLLGSNYISLSPGFSSQSFKDGDAIATTHSALILEQLIGQLMFKLTNNDASNSSATNNTPVSTNATNETSSTNTPSGETSTNTTQPGTAAT